MNNRIQSRRTFTSATHSVLEKLEGRRLLANEVSTIAPGTITTGTIGQSYETDVLRFDASAGQQFFVSLTGAKTYGNYSVRARITAPSGVSEVTSATSFKSFLASETGTYSVQIYDSGQDDYGTYAFGLERLNSPSVDATSINSGVIVGGAIDSALKLDQYTFDVAAGEQFDVLVGGLKTYGNYSVRVGIYDRTTGQKIDTLAPGAQRYTFIEPRQLVLAAYDSGGDDLGTYQVAVERVNVVNSDTVQITQNGTLNGTIGNSQQINHYRIAAKAGTVYSLGVEGAKVSGNYSTRLAVYNNLGQRVDLLSGRGATTFSTTIDEDVFVQVYDSGYDDTGTYTLSVSGFPTDDTPPPESTILKIDGTDANDLIEIDVDGPQYEVNLNGVTQFHDIADYTGIEVRAGGGNDQIAIGEGVGGVYVLGGAGRDVLVGGDGNDQLNGGGGNDVIYGNAGDDRLIGGDGADRLFGANGRDRIYGGNGDDLLEGGNHGDRLYGEDGNDTLGGGRDNDRLYAGAGLDRLSGGAGVDVLTYKAGVDSLDTDEDDILADL